MLKFNSCGKFRKNRDEVMVPMIDFQTKVFGENGVSRSLRRVKSGFIMFLMFLRAGILKDIKSRDSRRN